LWSSSAIISSISILGSTEAGVTEVTGALLRHTISVRVTFVVCFAAVAWVTSDEPNCVTVTVDVAVENGVPTVYDVIQGVTSVSVGGVLEMQVNNDVCAAGVRMGRPHLMRCGLCGACN